MAGNPNIQRLLPDAAIPSKDELRAYWHAVHREALEYIGERPLTLVRHSRGQTFFHNGPYPPLPEAVHSFTIQKREGGKGTRLWVDSLDGLLGLVDIGAVEIHPWQATVPDFESADLMVFDLDPGQDMEWPFVTETAMQLRDFLRGIGLEPWPKTSGGKGLHLMVPLGAGLSHDDTRILAKSFAAEFAERDYRYLVSSSSEKRRGRIFIDYLRNGRGSTTVGAYSPRARPGFPVSVPVSWQDVENGVRADAFTMGGILAGTNRKGAD